MGTVETIGRFQLIKGSPPSLPGHCAICGTVDTNREYIDFGFELDFYGVVYFCNICLTEMVGLLGYIPSERWQVILDHNMESDKYIGELENKNRELKNAIDHLSNLISSGSISVAVVPDVVPEDVESGQSEERGDTNTYNTDIAEREVRLIEQIDESGYTDIQHDDGSILDKLLNDI